MSGPFKTRVLAVEQPAATFYVGSVAVNELLTICRPFYKPAQSTLFGREASEPIRLQAIQADALIRSLDSEKFKRQAAEFLEEVPHEQYQRFVDAKRAKEIARYLNQSESLLPNTIILAVSLDYDESDVVHKSDGGLVIELAKEDSSTVILDGQHRVEGFRYLPAAIRDKMNVVVTFLVGIPFYQQAAVFAVINGRQKPVNRSIIFDLFGYAPPGGDQDEKLYEGLMAVSRFCSHVTRLLNRAEVSPWRSKIKMRGPGDDGIISQAAVVEYLSALVEPKTFSSRLRVLPLLYSFFQEGNPAGCASLLILYLTAIKTALPKEFENTQSLLWKNNGVAVIMRVLHDEIILANGASETMNSFNSIVEHWRKAPRADIESPPKTGGGGIQNDLYARFKTAMFSSNEIQRLESERGTLKSKLVSMGGIVE